ncbi:abortive infection family protein [Flavonifractor plautii]|uniref:abortive infection family protein n=1 Tax=Flavonifractor plautii TaxID=292800 RepID=UPI00232C6D28|nr:abortive infection family protein [Flavonifractor plautii]MDB7954828.1 abortive infection family protein [Flavonifractor plautii]
MTLPDLNKEMSLFKSGISYSTELDLTQLMKRACESIGLSSKLVDKSKNSGNIASKILGNLGAISQGMAELRNLYGDGHGKTRSFRPLPKRYADLSVGASVVAVKFMWDTYIEKLKK